MIEVDLYSFFWVGQYLNWVQSLEPPVPLSVIAPRLALARIALEHVKTNDTFRLLPETARNVDELLRLINSFVPPEPPRAYKDMMVVDELVKANVLIVEIARYLRDESKHLYLLCVEDQRALSAYTLIEKIENCFSPKCWNRIPRTAKREFEESGKSLAVERYAGSGFHSLRGIECVIRHWIEEVTGSLPKKRDWGHYIDVLKQNGADAGLTAVLDNIRLLERNPLMHPEDWLDIDDAIGIFNLAQTATARLIDDLEKKKPTP